MDNRIIIDITNYIFVSDRPQKVDIIFLPGGSFPEIPERAAKLYNDGYAPLLLPSGGVSWYGGIDVLGGSYDENSLMWMRN